MGRKTEAGIRLLLVYWLQLLLVDRYRTGVCRDFVHVDATDGTFDDFGGHMAKMIQSVRGMLSSDLRWPDCSFVAFQHIIIID